jgi:hypothetical protein
MANDAATGTPAAATPPAVRPRSTALVLPRWMPIVAPVVAGLLAVGGAIADPGVDLDGAAMSERYAAAPDPLQWKSLLYHFSYAVWGLAAPMLASDCAPAGQLAGQRRGFAGLPGHQQHSWLPHRRRLRRGHRPGVRGRGDAGRGAGHGGHVGCRRQSSGCPSVWTIVTFDNPHRSWSERRSCVTTHVDRPIRRWIEAEQESRPRPITRERGLCDARHRSRPDSEQAG